MPFATILAIITQWDYICRSRATDGIVIYVISKELIDTSSVETKAVVLLEAANYKEKIEDYDVWYTNAEVNWKDGFKDVYNKLVGMDTSFQ